jgi:nucleoid DNA-binding protein
MANKHDFIRKMADMQHITIKHASENYEAFLKTIVEFLSDDEEVNLCGYVKFSIKETKARKGTDPNTLEEIQIQQGKQIRIKAGTHIKNAVKK